MFLTNLCPRSMKIDADETTIDIPSFDRKSKTVDSIKTSVCSYFLKYDTKHTAIDISIVRSSERGDINIESERISSIVKIQRTT